MRRSPLFLLAMICIVVVLVSVSSLALLDWTVRSGWILERINSAQSKVSLHTLEEPEWSWSSLSGRDLQIVVHDAHVEASLHFDEYDLDWKPWLLIWRRFEATRVRIDGMRLRLRRTRTVRELCESTHGLPPIEGQADPVGFGKTECFLQEDVVPSPALPPEPERLFRILLADVRAEHIREVWIENQRWRGDATLVGRWRFHPTVSTDLQLQSLRLHEGAVRSGGGSVLEAVAGSVEGAIDDWVFDRELWPSLVANAELSVRRFSVESFVQGIRALKPLRSPVVPRLGGTATGSVAIELRQGRLKYADFDVRLFDWFIGFGGRLTGGNGEIELRLRGRDHLSQVEEGRIDLTQVWTKRGSEDVQTHDGNVVVWSDGNSRLDPDEKTLDLALRARAERLSPILGIMPSGLTKAGLRLTSGTNSEVEAQARLRARPGQTRLEPFRVQAPNLKVDGELQLERGRARGKAEVKAGVLEFSVEFP